MSELVTEGAPVDDDPPPPPVTSTDGTHELGAVSDAALSAAPPEPAAEPPAGGAESAESDEVEPAGVEPDDEVEPAGAERRRGKLHRIRTRPLRTLLMTVLAVVVAVTLPLLGVLAARTIANSREGRAVEPSAPVAQLPSTPASLLVGLDEQGRPASITVLSVGASGQGGTVLVMPVATSAYLDGPAKPSRLDAGYERGGLEGQTQAVESVLGISTAVSTEMGEDQLAELLEPYLPVTLTLESAVLDGNADGTTSEVLPAGEVTVSARDAARLLLARVDGESELARVPRAEALWRAILAKAGTPDAGTSTTAASSPATTAPPTGPPADLPSFLRAVASGAAGVGALRVEPSFDPAEPNAPELLQADVAYLRFLVASVMPGAVSPSNGNISFRVINPLADGLYAYRAIGRLAAVQANVVLVTETDGPVPERTAIVWHSPAGELQAGAFAPVLGAAAPTASGERIDGIDATVTLGRDFPAYLDAEDAKVAATSTTSTTTTVAATTTTTKRKG